MPTFPSLYVANARRRTAIVSAVQRLAFQRTPEWGSLFAGGDYRFTVHAAAMHTGIRLHLDLRRSPAGTSRP